MDHRVRGPRAEKEEEGYGSMNYSDDDVRGGENAVFASQGHADSSVRAKGELDGYVPDAPDSPSSNIRESFETD